MKKYFKFFASILLVLCFASMSCAQTKIDWKQIKNIPDTLEFKNVLLEHLLFKSAYQPVMESVHQGAIYYDNQLERLRVYEHGQWRDLSVSIASDSIGAPLTILGYLQASDIYASQSAYIGKDVNVKGNVNASGTSTFNYLKVNNALKVPTVASAALGVGSVYYDTTAKKLKVLNSSNQWDVVSVDVDNALSATSTNPVQNKVIYSKVDQIDTDLINGMAATLQASYNYSNGIATQAYSYADSTASASKNYADLQVNLLRSYVSQQLGSGTSDLYVNSIRTTNASVTNKLDAYNLKATHTFVVPNYYNEPVGNHTQYSGINGALIGSDNTTGTLKYSIYNTTHSATWTDKTIATTDNTVSDVATSTVDGTITVTKNGVSTNVGVKGLGSAAYANVASFSAPITIDSSMSSSSTNPVQNNVVKSYVDGLVGSLGDWKIKYITASYQTTGYYKDVPTGATSYFIYVIKVDNNGDGKKDSAQGIVALRINGSNYGPYGIYKVDGNGSPYTVTPPAIQTEEDTSGDVSVLNNVHFSLGKRFGYDAFLFYK